VAYQSHWTENGSYYVHVYFAYSHDYGRSWSESYRVDDNGSVVVHCDSPNIEVDKHSGYVYVAWKDNRTGVAKVYIDKSVDRGEAFGTDILVYNSLYDRVPTGIYSLYTVNIEIQEDGGVYVVWVTYYSDTYTNCDILFSQSNDNGQTFNTPTSVNPSEIEARHTKPWIAIDDENIIYVVYSKISSYSSNVYLARSLDNGSSFEIPVKVNDDFTNRYKGGKNIIVSPDGKIHVVWTDGRAGDGIQYLDIYFTTSLDGGLSFSPDIRVNDDPVISSPPDGWGKTCQGTPSIVSDSASRIHFVWEDFRNYVDISTYCRDIYYATSEDGSQFSKNLKVNYIHPESTSVSCADPNVAIDDLDNLYIVYSDAAAGDQIHHIYFTFIPSQEWEWTKFHHDSENTGFSPSTAPKMNITHWNYSAKGAVESSPAVANGMIFFGASNKVYALNRTTGELIWNFTAEEAIKSSPVVVDGLVFVGSDDKNIYALNGTNGNIIWNFTADDAIVSSPNIAEGLVLIGSNDFNLYALNQTNGQLVWNFTTTSQVKQSPAVAAELVFLGSGDQMYALNLTSGSVLWQQMRSVESSPAAIDGFVFFGSNTSMVSLNQTNGQLVWETSTGGVVDSSPAIAYGMVFFGCSNSIIYALNQTDGSLVWLYTTNGAVHSSPAIADGLLFVGSNDGYMYALNWTDGHLIWKYATGGRFTLHLLSLTVRCFLDHLMVTYTLLATFTI
jgi:outer membrane protein assembly factor BamB